MATKSSSRPEFNSLPGYVAANKLRGEPRQMFNELGLDGLDARALEEFLKAPVEAIEAIMFRRGNEAPPGVKFDPATRQLGDEENSRHLLDLFYKVACVLVMAERERDEDL